MLGLGRPRRRGSVAAPFGRTSSPERPSATPRGSFRTFLRVSNLPLGGTPPPGLFVLPLLVPRDVPSLLSEPPPVPGSFDSDSTLLPPRGRVSLGVWVSRVYTYLGTGWSGLTRLDPWRDGRESRGTLVHNPRRARPDHTFDGLVSG